MLSNPVSRYHLAVQLLGRLACPRVLRHLTPPCLIAWDPICTQALSNLVSRHLVDWPLPARPLDALSYLHRYQVPKPYGALWGCPLVILYQGICTLSHESCNMTLYCKAFVTPLLRNFGTLSMRHIFICTNYLGYLKLKSLLYVSQTCGVL